MLPVDREWRREASLRWGMGVSSPSAAGVGGCAGRRGTGKEGVFGLKSGELSSFLRSEGKETEGEGGITVTLRLEPPSDGMSSGVVSLVFGGGSGAGVTRICAGAAFFCADGFREWLCRGEFSPEDALLLVPGLVSFAKKLGAIFFSLFYISLLV